MLARFFWMSRNLNIWNDKQKPVWKGDTRTLYDNSYPCWRVCCLSFTFWLWLLQNCWQRCKSWQTRDSRIEFNLQMLESTEKGFIFSVVLRDPEFIRTFKAENINSLHHCLPLSYSKNMVARQDNLVDDFVIYCRHASLLFPFYNNFYKPDIDLRSLDFQYLKVKQPWLSLRWHFQILRVV